MNAQPRGKRIRSKSAYTGQQIDEDVFYWSDDIRKYINECKLNPECIIFRIKHDPNENYKLYFKINNNDKNKFKYVGYINQCYMEKDLIFFTTRSMDDSNVYFSLPLPLRGESQKNIDLFYEFLYSKRNKSPYKPKNHIGKSIDDVLGDILDTPINTKPINENKRKEIEEKQNKIVHETFNRIFDLTSNKNNIQKIKTNETNIITVKYNEYDQIIENEDINDKLDISTIMYDWARYEIVGSVGTPNPFNKNVFDIQLKLHTIEPNGTELTDRIEERGQIKHISLKYPFIGFIVDYDSGVGFTTTDLINMDVRDFYSPQDLQKVQKIAKKYEEENREIEIYK